MVTTLAKIGINVKLDCKATAQYVIDLNAGNDCATQVGSLILTASLSTAVFVELIVLPRGTVRYTLDGSEPTTRPITSSTGKPSSPLPISWPPACRPSANGKPARRASCGI